jgi:chromosome segregation ATPase
MQPSNNQGGFIPTQAPRYINSNHILTNNLSPGSMRGRGFEYHSPPRGRMGHQIDPMTGRSPEPRLLPPGPITAPLIIPGGARPQGPSSYQSQDNLEVHSLRAQLEVMKNEAVNWRMRCESLERKRNEDAGDLPEWESRLEAVVKENERLHETIKEKMQKEKTKKRDKDYDDKLLRATEELEKMNSLMERKEIEFDRRNEDWRREYGKLQEELQRKTQIIVDMESKLVVLSKDIEKFTNVVGQVDQLRQVEIMKKSIENLTRQNIDLERQVKILIAEKQGTETVKLELRRYAEICTSLEEKLKVFF